MKNKKTHQLLWLKDANNPLFSEKRMVWLNADNMPAETPENSDDFKRALEETKSFLTTMRPNVNISDELYDLAVAKRASAFLKLVEDVENNRADKGDGTIDLALAELEALRPELNLAGAIDRERTQVQVEGTAGRTEFKQTEKLPNEVPVVLPEKMEMTDEAFAKTLDSGELGPLVLDPLTTRVNREIKQVNSDIWNPTTMEGLENMYRDLREMDVMGANPAFYNSLFAILRKPIDNKPTDADQIKWFSDPFNHIANIQTLGADGEQYARAISHVLVLKGVVNKYTVEQNNSLARQEELNSDKYLTKGVDFIRSNLSQFKEAIRERDYATAGLYLAGAYAIYKTVKSFGGTDGGKTAMKWLTWGVAGYAGHTFLKNAGVDVLKMAGFRDKDFEVQGTPVESLSLVMKTHPELNQETKDLDFAVLMKCAEVPLKDLDDLYRESDRHGNKFIEPSKFPSIFPDLASVPPFKMGRGENGLESADGMNNVKLTAAQREYMRVAGQLYLIAKNLNGAYDRTLKVKHPNYKGVSYEEAIRMPGRELARVRHLSAAMEPYVGGVLAQGIDKSESVDVAEKHLFSLFNVGGVGISFDQQPNENGHFAAKIKNFPVVFVQAGKGYDVYLKNNYEGKMPGGNFITNIPIEGVTREAKRDQVVAAVDARMAELLSNLSTSGRKAGKELVFKGGRWLVDTTIPEAKSFDIKGEMISAEVVPYKNGKGLEILAKGGVRIQVDEEVAKRYPIAIALLPKLVGQKEFEALQVFANAGSLRIDNVDEANKTFDLKIGKSLSTKLKYNPAGEDAEKKKIPGNFVFAEADSEKKLIDDPLFGREYVNSLKSDENFELNKNAEELKELIKNIEPASWWNGVKNIVGSLAAGEVSEAVSGSIPDYYAEMTINTSLTEAYARLAGTIANADDLKKVEEERKNILADFNSKLKGVKSFVERENARLANSEEDWDHDTFLSTVIDPIRMSSTFSATYANEKLNLENMIYNSKGINLPGLEILGKADLSKKPFTAVEKLMEVFAYYTARLDNYKMGDIQIKLDYLDYPPTPTPGIADPKEDPAFRGHYILRYIDHVKSRIISKASGITNFDAVNGPEVAGFWNLSNFEQWLEKEGDNSPLDPLDNQKAFEHDAKRSNEKLTQLDEAVISEYKKAAAYLRLSYPQLDVVAFNNFLHSKVKNDLGLLFIPKENGKIVRNDKGMPVSQILQISDSIGASTSQKGFNKRGEQMRLIQEHVGLFLHEVFTAENEHGGYKFFTSQPDISDWFKNKYESLKRELKKATD